MSKLTDYLSLKLVPEIRYKFNINWNEDYEEQKFSGFPQQCKKFGESECQTNDRNYIMYIFSGYTFIGADGEFLEDLVNEKKNHKNWFQRTDIYMIENQEESLEKEVCEPIFGWVHFEFVR